MKPSILPLFLICVLILGSAGVRAEKADRDKPMNVEADALRYDELKQTSVFSGRVIVTKGTILIRGARIETRQDADGSQFGTVFAEPGKLAFFRQKREGLDEFIEGEAETIDYDGRADTVRLVNNAQLRRYRGATLSDEFTGGLILYNNTTNLFSIDGAPAKGSTGATTGRVRAMLTPKPQASEAAASAPATAPPLRPSSTLGGDKK
jgi:lipopolysaccharide export system protein LptA